MELVQEIIGKETNPERILEIVESNPGLHYYFIMEDTAACNEAIRIMLEHGADVNYKNFLGSSLFKMCVFNGNITVMRQLLEHGVKVSDEDSFYFLKYLINDDMPLSERQEMHKLVYECGYKLNSFVLPIFRNTDFFTKTEDM